MYEYESVTVHLLARKGVGVDSKIRLYIIANARYLGKQNIIHISLNRFSYRSWEHLAVSLCLLCKWRRCVFDSISYSTINNRYSCYDSRVFSRTQILQTGTNGIRTYQEGF